MKNDNNRHSYNPRHSYINKNLDADEEVFYRANIAWIPVIVRIFPFLIMAGVVGGITFGITDNFFIGIFAYICVVLLGILVQAKKILNIFSIDIVVTNKKLRIKEGIIRIDDGQSCELENIDTFVATTPTVFGRLFDYGPIEMNTIGANKTVYADVAKPKLLKSAAESSKERKEKYEWKKQGEANAKATYDVFKEFMTPNNGNNNNNTPPQFQQNQQSQQNQQNQNNQQKRNRKRGKK